VRQLQPEVHQQVGKQAGGFHKGEHYTGEISSTAYQQNKKKKLPDGSDYAGESSIKETNNFQNNI
jgi:hypothetical protein